MLAVITGDDVRSARDRALLAIGLATALRRSGLVALTCADIAVVPEDCGCSSPAPGPIRPRKACGIAIPKGQSIPPKALLLD